MRVPGLDEKDPQVLAQAIRELAAGGSNALGNTIQLDTGVGVTTVSDPRCTSGSRVFLSPLTATAAASAPYIASVGNGQFVIGHSVSGATDRTFAYKVERS